MENNKVMGVILGCASAGYAIMFGRNMIKNINKSHATDNEFEADVYDDMAWRNAFRGGIMASISVAALAINLKGE